VAAPLFTSSAAWAAPAVSPSRSDLPDPAVLVGELGDRGRLAVVGGNGGANVTAVPTGTATAVRAAIATMITSLAG
jgi:hypothetical protein